MGTLLARDPIAEAAEQADCSVDLLLIDDCDSAATLQKELRAWQPKLAANALVLVHGTLLEREESVHAIWQKFSEGRPAYNFEHGIGLGVTSFGAETLPENSPLTRLFASAEVRRDLLIAYDIIADRIEAQQRAREAERQKSALQLRQAWLDTLLLDRWKAQEVMDHLGREVTHLREVIDAGGHDPQATTRAFADLRQDRAKAQLIMDAQAEQLKQWVSRSEVLKAKIEEQKRTLDAAKNACRKDSKCFRISADGSPKERRSVPERIIRELRRIPKNLKRLSRVKVPSLGESLAEEEVTIDRYAKWITEHEPNAAGLEAQRVRAATFKVQPKISLLLPIHNTPVAFLDELLTSIATQTYGNFEICAVDGGSSDAATIECLKTWQQKEPQLPSDARPRIWA